MSVSLWNWSRHGVFPVGSKSDLCSASVTADMYIIKYHNVLDSINKINGLNFPNKMQSNLLSNVHPSLVDMHAHVQHTLTHLNAPSWTNEMSSKPCVHTGGQIPLLASHSDQNRIVQKMISMVWHKRGRIKRSYSSLALTHWGPDKMAKIWQITLSNVFSWNIMIFIQWIPWHYIVNKFPHHRLLLQIPTSSFFVWRAWFINVRIQKSKYDSSNDTSEFTIIFRLYSINMLYWKFMGETQWC